MDDSIYTLKRYNKKKKKRSYKLLYLIIIVLSLLICFKKDNTLKDKFKQNFNFAKFNKLYESIFGEFFPEISSNEQVPPVVGGESTENVSGATIYYKALNYTLQNHVDAQYKKALEGGNVISSSISRMSEELTTFMPQSRAFVTASKADLAPSLCNELTLPGYSIHTLLKVSNTLLSTGVVAE